MILDDTFDRCIQLYYNNELMKVYRLMLMNVTRVRVDFLF
jgi:hypothetical protein